MLFLTDPLAQTTMTTLEKSVMGYRGKIGGSEMKECRQLSSDRQAWCVRYFRLYLGKTDRLNSYESTCNFFMRIFLTDLYPFLSKLKEVQLEKCFDILSKITSHSSLLKNDFLPYLPSSPCLSYLLAHSKCLLCLLNIQHCSYSL